MLISLRNFAAGGRLYAEVFSQYGPFYNLLFAGLHRGLGLPLDTASARLITLVTWVACSLLAGMLVQRLTRSRWWAAATTAVIFLHLHKLTHEPIHPVGLIALLLGGGASAAGWLLLAGRDGRAFAVVTAASMLAGFVKINVGLFYFAGLAIVALWGPRTLATRPWARGLLIVLSLAAGAVLLQSLLHERWVQIYYLVYAVSAVATLVVIAVNCRGEGASLATLGAVFAAGAITVGTILAAALSAGIGWTSLVDGVVRAPLRHPTAFAFPFQWSRLTVPVLLFNALAFGGWLTLRKRRELLADCVVLSCRLLVGGGFLFSLVHTFVASIDGYLFSFGSGFLWSLIAPLGRPSPSLERCLHLLGALALFQLLHAFPVAGTQVSLSTLLLAVLVVHGLAQVGTWLAERNLVFASRALATVALAIPLWGCARQSTRAATTYFRQPEETFAQTGLHLSPWQTSGFSTLMLNTHAHGDMLFSLPGMFSLNLWSGLPTPTAQNITHWWALLDEHQQSQIARALEAAARPIVIVQENLITTGLAKSSFRPCQLTHYIDEHFTPLFAIDGYKFLVRNGAKVAALGVARWNSTNLGIEAFSCNFPIKLDSNPPRVEFIDYQSSDSPRISARETWRVTAVADRDFFHWDCTGRLPLGYRRADCDAVRFYDAWDRLICEARFERPRPQANPP